MLLRKFATLIERGLAAELREKYVVPHNTRKILHDIVHEKHNRPTNFKIPSPTKDWVINKNWKRR